MATGALVVNYTITSALLAREMSDLATSLGRSFIDAPVSRSQAGAESGQLTVMCGGAAAPFARAEPVIEVYAKAVELLGGAGSGQLTKMVNQICIAGVVQGLSEGLHFARRTGLDQQAAYEADSKGATQSWKMDNRWKTRGEGKFDFWFAVDWMCRDLGLLLDEAGRNGARLEMTIMVDSYYAELQAMGASR